jgi:hypothetical protein
MLKRRASKRFVLAETGEESAWNTTTDNDPAQPSPPQIEVGMSASTSSEKIEDVSEVVAEVALNAALLTVPQPVKAGGLK